MVRSCIWPWLRARSHRWEKGLAWKLPSQPSRAKLTWRSRRVSSATSDENLVRRKHSHLTKLCIASEVSDRTRRTKTSNYLAFSFFVVLDAHTRKSLTREEVQFGSRSLEYFFFFFGSGRCGQRLVGGTPKGDEHRRSCRVEAPSRFMPGNQWAPLLASEREREI